MSTRLLPCDRADFIKALKLLDFAGPFPGRRHEFMIYGGYPLHIPSYSEYTVPLLSQMLREVEGLLKRPIPREEWDQLRRGKKCD